MYKTLGNNITLTRGDTLQLKVSLYNQDGTEYEPASGDVIRFTMKKNYTDAEPCQHTGGEPKRQRQYKLFYGAFYALLQHKRLGNLYA